MFLLIDGNEPNFRTKSVVVRDYNDILDLVDVNLWNDSALEVPQLRIYALYKEVYHTEEYVKQLFSKRLRSVFAQFRCDILPLRIETGRFIGIPAYFRLCEICRDNVIEDEVHFLLKCEHYVEFRRVLFRNASQYFPDFTDKSDTEKLQFSGLIKATAEYLTKGLDKRTNTLCVDVSWRN